MLKQHIQHNLRLSVAFYVHHNAHTLAVRFLVHVRNTLDALILYKLRYTFDKLRFIDLIRKLGNYNMMFAARTLFYFRFRAYNDSAAAGAICLFNARPAHYKAAGRKIRRRHVFHKLVYRNFRIVYKRIHCGNHFSEIMRRNVCRHAYRNAVGAVDQKIWKAAWKNGGLHERVVKVGIPIYGLFVQVAQHFSRDLAQTRLGITHGCRRIAVHGAEIAVAVNQRAAYRKILRKSYKRAVNRAVSVRMIFAKTVADDTRAFPVRLIRIQIKLSHRIQNAALNGLKSVARVGNGAGYVDRHSVGNERFFNFVVHLDLNYLRILYFFLYVVVFIRHILSPR